MSSSTKHISHRMLWALGVAAVAVTGLGLVVLRPSSASTSRVPTFTVTRGPLTISVSERGTVKARQQEVLKCLVEGQTTIIYLIDEGTRVKKGDLLVELDSSKLEDLKVDQQIKVQNAEANFIRSRETLEVTKNQAQADTAKAQLDAQFAKEDLRKYDEGEYPNLLREAENKITIATEELQRAVEKLRWTEQLFKEKYVSNTELQADRLGQKKVDLDLQLAQDELKLLQQYTYKRKVDELKSGVEQTTLALERAKRKALADIAQADADLKAKDSEFVRSESQLTKTVQMIKGCKMIAPVDGLVVYASTGQPGRQQDPLAEGSTVRERQDLIYLPTASDMTATVKIHESNLNKVRPGLPVLVTVDALPGKTYNAKVAKIAPLPDGQSFWMNPDLKVYVTDIYLDGDGSALKTGMSCNTQIVVENYTDVVSVPVQAIVRENGESVAYVLIDEQPRRRVVQIGMDNGDRVHVIDGLKEGERVSATPPITGGNGNAPGTAAMAGMQVPAAATRPAALPRMSATSPAPSTQATADPAAESRPTKGRRRNGGGQQGQ